MQDQETVASIRRMTPDEKDRQWAALVRLGWQFGDLPDAEAGKRKWADGRRQHDLADQRILSTLRERGL